MNHSNHSNHIYSLENSTNVSEGFGVAVGYCGGRGTVNVLIRARAYAAAFPGAVSGKQGHDRTLELACVLTWGFCLDEGPAMEVMRDWNSGCQPPWKEDELRRKILEALKRNDHRRPRGHMLGLTNRTSLAFLPPLPVVPAQSTVWKIERRPEVIDNKPPPPIQVLIDEEMSVETFGAALVPGRSLLRPKDIVCSDDTWRTLNAHPLCLEPTIHLAFALFGPGCTLLRAAAPFGTPLSMQEGGPTE